MQPRLLKPLLLAILIFFVDFSTKIATHFFLPHMSTELPYYPYGGIGVFENLVGVEFSITHQTNTGAAWGVLSEFPTILLTLRMSLVGGLMIYSILGNVSNKWSFPMAMLISGALGNIVDFFIYGHVIDMFHFVFWGYDYPVFNCADTVIFIGVFWMLFLSWKNE